MALMVKPLQMFFLFFFFFKKLLQKCFWVVLYQADDFSAQCSFWLAAMATKMQKKRSLKIISSQTI